MHDDLEFERLDLVGRLRRGASSWRDYIYIGHLEMADAFPVFCGWKSTAVWP